MTNKQLAEQDRFKKFKRIYTAKLEHTIDVSRSYVKANKFEWIAVYRDINLSTSKSGWRQLSQSIKSYTPLNSLENLLGNPHAYGKKLFVISDLQSEYLEDLLKDMKFGTTRYTNLCIMHHLKIIKLRSNTFPRNLKKNYDLIVQYYSSLPE